LFVKKLPEGLPRAYPVEATHIAEGMGRKIAANMVALGAVAALAGVVSKNSMEAAVMGRAPKGTEEGNREAFLAGYAATEQMRSPAL
jgi:2-oxoglutarate ferredoxin oxidoreductase subunit gamma